MKVRFVVATFCLAPFLAMAVPGQLQSIVAAVDDDVVQVQRDLIEASKLKNAANEVSWHRPGALYDAILNRNSRHPRQDLTSYAYVIKKL
jgi:hypothetical protein